jgi:uncharacterized membrane protein YozB (DUF420 family)
MVTFLEGAGFLGTHASLRADIALVLIIISTILFTLGWRLVINKKYAAHQVVQTLAVGINALVVLVTMLSIFLRDYLPAIPGIFDNRMITLIALHSVTGTLGLLFGIYVVLVADKILPVKLRYKNFKPVMRGSYIAYLLLTLGGIGLYLTLYV